MPLKDTLEYLSKLYGEDYVKKLTPTELVALSTSFSAHPSPSSIIPAASTQLLAHLMLTSASGWLKYKSAQTQILWVLDCRNPTIYYSS